MKFYIAKRSCGCIVGGHMDRGQNRKVIANWVAAWIKDGLTVENIEADEVRVLTSACEHERRDDIGPLFKGRPL